MIALVLLLITVPIFSQYIKAVKGDVVPFDTAVITHIDWYRAEKDFMQKQRAAIDTLQNYITVYKDIINLQEAQLADYQKDKKDLTNQRDLLKKQLDKKNRWFRKPEIVGPVFLVLGILIAK